MKIALRVAYDGAGFAGFQRQPDALTVQGCLEEALSQVLRQPISLCGAGRTDLGVHATGQVVSLVVDGEVSIARLCHSVNAVLREPVVVLEGVALGADHPFHARFSAVSRTYRYLLLAGCDPCDEMLWGSRSWCLPQELDPALARQAAELFVGEHDFTTFSFRMSEKPSCVRHVTKLELEVATTPTLWSCRSQAQLWTMTITADGFLRRMVRLIVAAVAEVGMGKRSLESVRALLAARDATKAPHPAPPEGLYLSHIGYAEDPFEGLQGSPSHGVARLPSKHRFRNL